MLIENNKFGDGRSMRCHLDQVYLLAPKFWVQ